MVRLPSLLDGRHSAAGERVLSACSSGASYRAAVGLGKPGGASSTGDAGVPTVSRDEVEDLAKESIDEDLLGMTKPRVTMQPLSSTVVEVRRVVFDDPGLSLASQIMFSSGAMISVLLNIVCENVPCDVP